MKIWEIIKRGLKNSPCVGMGGRFYDHMFMPSAAEWKSAVDGAHRYSESSRRFWETPGNCPCYSVEILERAGYVYLYDIDGYGNLSSRAYTHKVISDACDAKEGGRGMYTA